MTRWVKRCSECYIYTFLFEKIFEGENNKNHENYKFPPEDLNNDRPPWQKGFFDVN